MNKLTEQWSPILDVCGNIDPIYYDDLAKHAQFLCKKEVKPERLAMELRVLSRLDLSKVWFTQNLKICKEYQWNLRFDDGLFDVKIQGIDIERRVESSLMDELIFTLSRHIEKEGGLIIYDLYNITNVEYNLVTVKSHYSPFNVIRFNKLKKVKSMINDR